ncbi:hypothetical protein NT01EI_2065 [Edwardsiella ictaluri 93-146]|uniref:Uncharacterized protein n=1 Tax=Edwardsiella ictaluri (strain 93-146) TaxID=634503 RepID=C5BDC4_EDWI9|nr:hypothetical protein NT01EI_2065 [Edwardsiella ictaluri 93-146]
MSHYTTIQFFDGLLKMNVLLFCAQFGLNFHGPCEEKI